MAICAEYVWKSSVYELINGFESEDRYGARRRNVKHLQAAKRLTVAISDAHPQLRRTFSSSLRSLKFIAS